MHDIHVFAHRAMATQFQVRIAGEEATYAAQAAQTAFALTDQLESLLSRFRPSSDIAQIAALAPGESLRVAEPTFECLALAQRLGAATRGAFSVTAAALQSQPAPPRWSLRDFSVCCDAGKVELDLGAIGKGFALDRMAEVLREWSCPAFLLVAGGSSVLAGEPPGDQPGWSCGLGEDESPCRYWLKQASLSGSGLAVKGRHILDPRTGQPAERLQRTWALCDHAAESDALSTACMVLAEAEIAEILAAQKSWLVFLEEKGNARPMGERALPPTDP